MVISTPGRGVRDTEGTALEPLRPDGQAIAVPVEDLDPIPSLVDEDEEMAGEGIELEGTRDERGEAVEALSHVGRFFGEVNTDGGVVRTWSLLDDGDELARVWGSKPGGTAIRRPLPKSSSRGCG